MTVCADLWKVVAPRRLLGQARPEDRPAVGAQLLGGTVPHLRQRSHLPVLGRPSVRALLNVLIGQLYALLIHAEFMVYDLLCELKG